jgi:hypothetical protein
MLGKGGLSEFAGVRVFACVLRVGLAGWVGRAGEPWEVAPLDLRFRRPATRHPSFTTRPRAWVGKGHRLPLPRHGSQAKPSTVQARLSLSSPAKSFLDVLPLTDLLSDNAPIMCLIQAVKQAGWGFTTTACRGPHVVKDQQKLVSVAGVRSKRTYLQCLLKLEAWFAEVEGLRELPRSLSTLVRLFAGGDGGSGG